MVSDVAYLLFLQAAVGSTIMLRALVRHPMGDRFFRINAPVVWVLAVLSLFSAPWHARSMVSSAQAAVAGTPIPASFPTGVVLGATIAFAASLTVYCILLFVKRTAADMVLRLALLAGIFAAAEAGLAFSVPLTGVWPRIVAVAGSILSSAVIGSGLVGMLVGHWYLNAHDLPWTPFEMCAGAFLALLGAQSVLVVVGISAAGQGSVLREAFALTRFVDVFVWVRLLPGLVAPIILAAMIRRSVQLRANMSATGLFYVAMILVACGEAFSRFLLVTEGILH